MASSEGDISQLSEEQQLALQQYVGVTDQDTQAAIPLLARSQWNVQVSEGRYLLFVTYADVRKDSNCQIL
jgi:FAS-associated factor 2